MARIDEYNKAAELAREKLSAIPEPIFWQNMGIDRPEQGELELTYLGEKVRLSYPQFICLVEGEQQLSHYDEIIILHYLLATPIPKAQGEDISFRDVPGASFYFGPFSQRSSVPLAKRFGADLEGFARVAGLLGAEEHDYADACYSFTVLPDVDVKISLWQADEDFDAAANLTFDKTIASIFDAEGVAALATALTFTLIGMAGKKEAT